MSVVGAKITSEEKNRIEALVDKGCFLNSSDFVREAIRDLLERFPTDEATKRTSQDTHEKRSQEYTGERSSIGNGENRKT